MEALTQANLRLLRRLEAIESRLRQIEERLGVAGEQVASNPEPPVAEMPNVSEPFTGQPITAPAAVRQPALETRFGLTWLNRVAVITCILAVAFFFKHAIDNQWIGEMGRVALGLLTGVLCLTGAEALFRRGHWVYAQGIAGLGIAIFYLSFHAAFAFYRILLQGPAFALMALTTVLAAAAALRYGARAIAILGLLGGYATPALLSTGADRPWFFLAYLLLLNGGSLSLARLRDWRVLEDLAFLGTVVLYGVWLANYASGSFAPDPGWQLPGWLFSLAYYALFAWTGRQRLTCLAQILTCWAAALLWPDRTWPPLASLAVLSVAALAIADRFSWRYLAPVALGSWLLGYMAWESNFETGVPTHTTLAFHAISFAVFLIWLPWRLLGRRAPVRPADLALAAANAALFFTMFYLVLEDAYNAWQGFATASLAAAHFGAGWLMWRGQPRQSRDQRPPLARSGAQNIPSGQSMAVSVLTALYAIFLVTAGVVTRSLISRLLGLVLVTLVVAKLYLYDVWLLGRLHRIIAFAALGLLLLTLSFIYSRYRAVIEGLWQERQDA
jgi:uncharacterized membrane protein